MSGGWGFGKQTFAGTPGDDQSRRKRTAAIAHHAGDSVAIVVPNHERVHPVRLKLTSQQSDDRLLRLQFAIIIAPDNLRPCRGQTFPAVFGLLLPDRTRMVWIWR